LDTTPAAPLWQVPQVWLPTKLLAAWVYVTPLVQLVVDEWQPSHEVTPLWVVVLGLDVNPKVLEKWQVAQGPGGDTLAWYLPFDQITVPLWQVEQSVVAVTPIWLPDMPMAPPLLPCDV
jgi:hypothetical protein